ncbi:hypothetical protein CHS0354_015009 [Potamilus streckersoni]|uniref:Uncharacterized protein n=1 Tax=Potamilus streckersoni TaxID=2493646 RepID=A0AAE0SMT5_9BIVA|nr:hypothetical protein CHS0354_015009 [Potamilus streckersoni]
MEVDTIRDRSRLKEKITNLKTAIKDTNDHQDNFCTLAINENGHLEHIVSFLSKAKV